MPTVSEPRDPDITSGRASSLRYWFIVGTLGEHTFYTSLTILGLSPDEARAEVQSALTERKQNVSPKHRSP